jgi:hypothetical protein
MDSHHWNNSVEWLQVGSINDMNQKSEFPFARARRVTLQEHQEFSAALVEQFGIDLKRRVRPILKK